ncbi:major facilitator superfamily transporter [Gluconacetobacter sacchari DSM 12717]|uniref:MFS transporter n=2 Tax=Gluconacetobacter sacchari TaxID=92759 RepID=A0A7W4I9N9_9PROT|nr:MFS transporter [Gluconacetobacter sacchari]MBB2158844.1 MFS transporter [Gluconacetobacter sacchari]GBQ21212.1 major facilitator superfamily transporter [Gluconacetobacter sacchari DSM 12717]
MSATHALSPPVGDGSFATPADAARASRTRAVVVMLATGTACAMEGMILSGLLTPMKADLRLSDTAFGSVMAVSTLAGIVGAPLFALLTGRFGRKAVLVGTVILWSVASAGSALAAGLATLVFWRALTSFGIAAYQGIAPGWLADLYDRKARNLVFALFMARNKLGSALAFGFGGWIAARYGWHQAFLLTGLPGLLLALFLFHLPEPRPGQADGRPIDAPRDASWKRQVAVLRIGPYVTHLLALSLFFSGMMTAQMWLPPFLHRVHGLDNLHATRFLSATLLLTMPAGPLGGWLTGRYLARRAWGLPASLAATTLIAAVLFTVSFTTGSLRVSEIAALGAIVAFGSTAGSLTTLLIETVPATLRTISGSFGAMASTAVSGFFAPWLLGALSDQYGLARAILIGPLFYACAGLLWIGLALRPAGRKTSA